MSDVEDFEHEEPEIGSEEVQDLEAEPEEEAPEEEEEEENVKPAKSGTKRKAPPDKDAEGRPAKAAKTAAGAAVTGGSPEEVILKYMLDQNRPFSALQVYENLHRTIKKAQVPRILDKLVEEGKLVMKAFKKNKIYHANQDQFPEVDSTEVARMDEEIDRLTAGLRQAEATAKHLEAEIAEITKQPTTAEAEAEIQRLEKELAEKKAKLAALTTDSKSVTQADVDQAQRKFNEYFKAWKQRKAAVLEMVTMATENMSMKPKKFMEARGIETDEDVNVNIKDFEQFFKPLPRR